jgi:FKBP-type peptidyl-prolyl cis-trans isomerase
MKTTRLSAIYLFLCLCLYTTQVHSQQKNPEKRCLYLTLEEEADLRAFIGNMCWSSEMGYVLYGNKPLCFEGYYTENVDSTGGLAHHCSTSIYRGVQVWKKLKLPNLMKDYLFIHKQSQSPESSSSQVFIVNKKSFRNVFNEHSSLFRYVLGPDVTVDRLFFALHHHTENFGSILKHDKVLIGLVLGFGLENSLYVSRDEELQKLELPQENIHKPALFSFLQKKNPDQKSFFLSPPFLEESLLPQIGYHSIQEERETLQNKIISASGHLESYAPNLIFGRIDSQSPSIMCQIQDYEASQIEIIRILDQEDWLEKVLSQLCQCEITLKINPEQDLKQNDWLKKPLDQIVARAIYFRFKMQFEDDPNDFHQFLSGMEAAEKKDAIYIAPFARNRDLLHNDSCAYCEGFIQWAHYKLNGHLFDLQSVIDQLKKIKKTQNPMALENSEHQIVKQLHVYNFRQLNKHETDAANHDFEVFDRKESTQIKPLTKGKLYYESTTLGTGKEIDPERSVILSYVLQSTYGNVLEDCQDGKILDLKRTIRGFREGLAGLHVGESGVLYIHPEWGWKNHLNPPYFSPYLIAKFTILSNE